MATRNPEACCGNCPYAVSAGPGDHCLEAFCQRNVPFVVLPHEVDYGKPFSYKLRQWPEVGWDDVCGQHPDFLLPEGAAL